MKCIICGRDLFLTSDNPPLNTPSKIIKRCSGCNREIVWCDCKTIKICLYEILVPTVRKDGTPYHTRFHRIFDGKVREISKGLTIFTPAKGQWISEENELVAERMIPVRIACTREQIDKIAEITVKYYEQDVVMFYRISDEVEFVRNKE